MKTYANKTTIISRRKIMEKCTIEKFPLKTINWKFEYIKSCFQSILLQRGLWLSFISLISCQFTNSYCKSKIIFFVNGRINLDGICVQAFSYGVICNGINLLWILNKISCLKSVKNAVDNLHYIVSKEMQVHSSWLDRVLRDGKLLGQKCFCEPCVKKQTESNINAYRYFQIWFLLK